MRRSIVDVDGGKDTVLVPDPAYPVYERGAEFAGARVVRLPLREDNGFLPQVGALDSETLDRTALVWVNYPNNPTAASAPPNVLRRPRVACRSARFPRLLR